MKLAGESEQLRSFFQTGRRLDFQKGELILRADDEPRGVYLIERGLIKIYALSKQGDEHVMHFFGPGDFFPMIWIFKGHIRRTYYQALEPVSTWVVPRDDFVDFVTTNKKVTFELMEEMVQRYMRYAGRIENLLYSDSMERCGYRLLSLGARFGFTSDLGLVIKANITHEDMAHSLNMTRETFGRCLSRFQKRNIITYDEQRHIVLTDMPALIKLIGRDEVETMWPELVQ